MVAANVDRRPKRSARDPNNKPPIVPPNRNKLFSRSPHTRMSGSVAPLRSKSCSIWLRVMTKI